MEIRNAKKCSARLKLHLEKEFELYYSYVINQAHPPKGWFIYATEFHMPPSDKLTCLIQMV